MCLMEIAISEKMVGKSLADLDVRRKYKVNVVAVKHEDGTTEISLDPTKALLAGDMMVVIGSRQSVEALEDGI